MILLSEDSCGKTFCLLSCDVNESESVRVYVMVCIWMPPPKPHTMMDVAEPSICD